MKWNSRGFRDALGHFATGVAVISAATPQGTCLGLTINSFTSVSLDPPLVLWSLDRASDRFGVLNQVEKFGINILGHSAKELSQRLSRKGESGIDPSDIRKGEHGVPLLISHIAAFECETHQRIDAGDHVILIGRVLSFTHVQHEHPLLYYCGGYCELVR